LLDGISFLFYSFFRTMQKLMSLPLGKIAFDWLICPQASLSNGIHLPAYRIRRWAELWDTAVSNIIGQRWIAGSHFSWSEEFIKEWAREIKEDFSQDTVVQVVRKLRTIVAYADIPPAKRKFWTKRVLPFIQASIDALTGGKDPKGSKKLMSLKELTRRKRLGKLLTFQELEKVLKKKHPHFIANDDPIQEAGVLCFGTGNHYLDRHGEQGFVLPKPIVSWNSFPKLSATSGKVAIDIWTDVWGMALTVLRSEKPVASKFVSGIVSDKFLVRWAEEMLKEYCPPQIEVILQILQTFRKEYSVLPEQAEFWNEVILPFLLRSEAALKAAQAKSSSGSA